MEKDSIETILNTVLDTIFVFDPKAGKPIMWNKAFNDISGYSDDEIAKMKAPDDWYCPEDLEITEVESEKLLRGEKSITEISLITKDKKLIPTEYTASMLKDTKGNPRYIIAVGRDISDRKQAEDVLKKSEKKYRTLFEAESDALFMVDAESGDILEANSAASDLYGYSKKELCSLKAMDLSNEPMATKQIIAKSWGKARIPHRLHKKKDGTIFPVEISANYLILNDRKINISAVRDISERNRMERALEKHRNNLEQLVEQRTADLKHANELLQQEIVERTEVEAALRKVNRALKTMGFCNKAMLHEQDEQQHLMIEVCRIVVKEGGYRMAWVGFAQHDEAKTVTPEAQWGFEDGYLDTVDITWADTERGQGPTGTAIRIGKPVIVKDMMNDPKYKPWQAEATKRGYCSGLALPLVSENEVFGAFNIYSQEPNAFDTVEVDLLKEISANLAYGIKSRQIKAKKEKAERALEKQRVLSMRADRLLSLGEMSAGMAHELNQPLQGIRGAAEHLLIAMDKGWDISGKRVREKLELVIAQADRMTNIIEHVRLFAREAGRPECKQVDVNEVLKSSVKMIEKQFLARGVHIKLELDDGLPSTYANPFSLEEVFLNLMFNSRDAIGEQMGSDKEFLNYITVRSFKVSGKVECPIRVQISDHGTGIPDALRMKVFEPFFTTKQPDKGTGLGLSICKSIVEDLGGKIDIQSKLGKGTTVTVSLPMKPLT